MLIKLSALQMPLLTQTARGGKRMASKPRKMSLPHMMLVGLSNIQIKMLDDGGREGYQNRT